MSGEGTPKSRRASNARRRSQDYSFPEDGDAAASDAGPVIATAVLIDDTSDDFLKKDGLRQPKMKGASAAGLSKQLDDNKKRTETSRKPSNATLSTSFKAASSAAIDAATDNSWPPKLRDEVVNSFDRTLNEAAGHRFLERHKWPLGLRKALIKNCKKIPIRFFIVDDSGRHLGDNPQFIDFSSICQPNLSMDRKYVNE